MKEHPCDLYFIEIGSWGYGRGRVYKAVCVKTQ